MRVKINRNVCPAHLAFCERCLGQFLKYPLGYERRCFEELVDDHSDVLTIELHTGENDLVLALDEAQRRTLANEGWAYFVDIPVPMYRNNPK
ncbi:MAG: hypothetical protein HXY40_15140 [Chloroflexi bacterium]|nr:hypothetical protein [Chloroflexota bacterium]